MSTLTDDSYRELAIQPSLVYPSLPKYNRLQTDDDNRQTCIHFASRLIKLRSELRSPSYMKSTPLLSRVNSLPNVNRYQPEEDDEQSIITYITDETSIPVHSRRKNHHYLALPPITSKRSLSLREMTRPMKNENRYTIGFTTQLFPSEMQHEKEEEEEEIEKKKEEVVMTPTPSHSNKSVYSTMSSDSEDDLNNKNLIKTRATAFFVSLSPCSAAAASVAKWKRRNIRKGKHLI
ncbi:uncharacterized protein EV154DRAFT_501852 [Mucor mucedo]|uniref:uncharacterized protein n=1 Tax=Mucor mucedo TaxID=29922 RepID=UPI0022200AB6|nr:uncharacterized protein EV154DRAFT_501852 [Mucor mucedo]KAI7893393.1 hypothetical protein EV154DRAFT_501852 [Mucor mucedo]